MVDGRLGPGDELFCFGDERILNAKSAWSWLFILLSKMDQFLDERLDSNAGGLSVGHVECMLR